MSQLTLARGGASFGDALGAHEKELRTSGASPGHIRNRGWLLRFWFHLVTVLDHESAIAAKAPTPLMLALRALFADGSRKRTPTARAAKIHPDALKAWMSGKLPARDQEVSALSRLEDVCHKTPGYLTSLLPTRMPSRRVMKATRAPSTNQYRARAARLSLEWYRLPRNAMYANETLRHQWLELLRDKIHGSARGSASTVIWTAEMVDQLYDAPVEALDASWRLRSLRVREPARWFDCVDGYVIPSAAKRFNQVRMLLGWASKPVAEGGAGLAYDQLTLALCADHKLVRRFSAWRIARNGFPTATDTDFLKTIKTLLTEHAYLPRTPAVGASVGIADPVAWKQHCATARSIIVALRKSLMKVAVKNSRDAEEPLAKILQLEAPLDALIRGVLRLELDKHAYPGLYEKYWARKLVLLSLPISNPLRAENLSRLTYRADNTGNVRKAPTGWRIFINKSDIKNINGAAKDRDYDQPIDPNVWPYLEQYLTTYRSQFDTSADYLFAPSATRSSKPYLSPQKLSEAFSDLLQKYVPECAEGSGVHSVRHIVATHVVITTGDYILAAHLLHDKDKTVQEQYAHLLKEYHERRRSATMTPMLAGLSSRAIPVPPGSI